MRKPLYLFLFFNLLISKVLSQDNAAKYAETIKVQDLKAHLSIVASDSFEGRGTAEKGQKLAAQYLADQFSLIGLKPMIQKEDSFSFFQTFNVYKRSWDSPYLKVNDKKRTFLKDFFCVGHPGIVQEEEMDIVYGGQGEEIASGNKKLDIKGKGVVLFFKNFTFPDSTVFRNQTFALINSSSNNKTFKTIIENGAKAIFVVIGNSDNLFNDYLNENKCEIEEALISFNLRTPIQGNNVFFIPPSLGAEMLSVSTEKLTSLQNNPKPLTRQAFKNFKAKKIKIKASEKSELLETENVLGVLEGSDKKDEAIVISAHYDHEGIKCGQIYNGADDDGTGTVSILELAQAFALAKKEGHGPRRSIIFLSVTGEEKGLLGSKYYTEHPVVPLSQTIADLNIDMTGRIDKFHQDENYIYLIGSNRLSTKLHSISEEANLKYTGLNIDYKYNAIDDPEQFYYRSDHYNFAKNNIPVIFYFSGTHKDYHQPTDDVEKILFNKVEKTARLVFFTAWELANREERITVDVKKK